MAVKRTYKYFLPPQMVKGGIFLMNIYDRILPNVVPIAGNEN